jgi:hypothetical protein
MRKKVFLIIASSLFFVWACNEVPDMSDPKDNVPPGPITNPKVENINGGAIITYNRPSDSDLMGVKAVYSLTSDGQEMEMFSSIYVDTIQLNGFPDTEERSIKLIAVDKSFNESVPVDVRIKPLTPPIQLIRETIEASATFGGIFVKWVNDFDENIALSLFYEDSIGIMSYDDTYYSVEENGEFSFRGYDAVERRFRIEVRDRWDNYAEPIEFTTTPLFETEILPKDPNTGDPIWDIAYGLYDGTRVWRGDAMRAEGGGWDQIWSGGRHTWGLMVDGVYDDWNYWTHVKKPILDNYFPDNTEDLTYLLPMYFIFDLKEEVKLSRFKFWAFPWNSDVFPDVVEIWGTNKTPKGGPRDFDNITESLNYWTEWNVPPYVEGKDTWKNDWSKLGDVQIRPTPSGAYYESEWTADDRDRRWAGYELTVDPEATAIPVRYIRFVFINTEHEQCYIQEVKIWGQYVNPK